MPSSLTTMLLTAWSVEPVILGGAGLAAAAYTFAITRGRRHGHPVHAGHVVAFFCSLAVASLALVSPLAAVAERYLLSAHMLQHLLLILVMAPLLILGLPPWLLRSAAATRAGRWLISVADQPLLTATVFTVGLAAWHLPPLYNAALASTPLHRLEHATFVGTALLFWWPVIARLPERDPLTPLGRVAYLFAANLANTLIAAPITFAPIVLYPAYLQPADPAGLLPMIRTEWGLTPLVDQHLAGLLMWVPMGIVLMTVALAILVRWFDRSESAAATEPVGIALAAYPAANESTDGRS